MGKVVQGIWLHHGAQTLSLPINPTTVVTAARFASDVAGRIGEAISFDRILNAAPSAAGHPSESGAVAAGSGPASGPGAWLDRALTRIRDLLTGSGISADRPLEFSADPTGNLRLRFDHPQAAAIESTLASDQELQGLVAKLVRETGQKSFTLAPPAEADLTDPMLRTNMR